MRDDLEVRSLCLLLLVQTLLPGADHSKNAAQVVELVLTSVYSDHDDVQLAHDLHKTRMSEQLDPHAVFYFERLGVGPQADRELHRLLNESARLKPPADLPLAIQPLPSEAGQKEMLEKVRQYAQSYVRCLPNFLCDQVTRRYSNLTGFGTDGNPQFSDALHLSDTFKRSLRFVNGVEEAVVPHRPGSREMKISTKRGQSISSGEFGTDMGFIFGPGVEPKIQWDHWEMFKGKRTAVFSYFVGLPQSKFTLMACCVLQPGVGELQQRVTASIRGVIYVDPATGVIRRLAIRPASLPKDFHLKESETIIDYGDVTVGGRSYTLPVHALAFLRGETENGTKFQMKLPIQINRNEISFLDYRKFEAESVLTFANSKITYDAGSQK